MEKPLNHSAVTGIVLVCFTSFYTVFPMAQREVISIAQGEEGDPFLSMQEAIARLVTMLPPEAPLAYFTNPEDYVYLSQKILSGTSDGVVEKDLTLEHLFVMNRFFRTQYYAAPFVLDLYRVEGEAENVIANFRGSLAKSPPYQIGNLRLRRDFGQGIVLYWNVKK